MHIIKLKCKLNATSLCMKHTKIIMLITIHQTPPHSDFAYPQANSKIKDKGSNKRSIDYSFQLKMIKH